MRKTRRYETILTKYTHIIYLLLKMSKKFNTSILNVLTYFYFSVKLHNNLCIVPHFKKQLNFKNYLIKTNIVRRRDKIGKSKRIKLSFTTWKIYKQLYKSNKINKKIDKLVMGSLFFKFHQTINRVWRETLKIYNINNITADFKLWSEINKTKNASAFKLVELPTMAKNLHMSSLMLFTVKNALRKHYVNTQKRVLNSEMLTSSKGPIIHQVSKTHTQYKTTPTHIYLSNTHNHDYFSRVYTNNKIKTKITSSSTINFKTPLFTVNNDQIKIKLFDKIFANNQFELSNNVLPVTTYNKFPLLTTKYFTYLRKRQHDVFGCVDYDRVLYNTIRTRCQDITTTFSNYKPLHNLNIRHNHITQITVNTLYSCFYTQFIVTFLEKYLHSKVWIKIDTRTAITPFYKSFINQSSYIHNIQNRRVYKDFSTIEFLEIFILTLQKCDLQILMLFFKKVLESTHFKNHKKILSAMFDIIRKNSALFKLNNVSGFSFDIRGKVGVTGNAKKRHIFFSVGKTSTTTQKLKSQWQQVNVWTQTGQMGITCVIQY